MAFARLLRDDVCTRPPPSSLSYSPPTLPHPVHLKIASLADEYFEFEPFGPKKFPAEILLDRVLYRNPVNSFFSFFLFFRSRGKRKRGGKTSDKVVGRNEWRKWRAISYTRKPPFYFAGPNLVTSVALIHPLYATLFLLSVFLSLSLSLSLFFLSFFVCLPRSTGPFQMQKTPGESKQSPADNVYAVRLTMRIVFCALCLARFHPARVLLFYLSTYRRTRDRVHTTAGEPLCRRSFSLCIVLVWPGTVYSTVTGCLAESISRTARVRVHFHP